MIGNFMGLNFHGLGSSDNFMGLYFCGVPTVITELYTVAKIQYFLWITKAHESTKI